MRNFFKISFLVLLSSHASAASFPRGEVSYPDHATLGVVAMNLQASVARLNDVVLRASGMGGGMGGEQPPVWRFQESQAAALSDEGGDVLERDVLAGPYIKTNVTPQIASGANFAFQASQAAQIGDFATANNLRFAACSAIQQGIYYAEQAKGTVALIPVGVITPDFLFNEIQVYNDSRLGLGC